MIRHTLTYSEFDALLDHFGVNRIVVGHTPTQDRDVFPMYKGKLLMANTQIWHSRLGKITALWVDPDGENWYQMGRMKHPQDQHKLVSLLKIRSIDIKGQWQIYRCALEGAKK